MSAHSEHETGDRALAREPIRLAYLVHDSPGRVRFRLPWLREHRDEADAIAVVLAALPGVAEVQARPFTGSVLVSYDPQRADQTTIGKALLAASHAHRLLRAGEESPDEIRELLRDSLSEGSELTKAAVACFEGLNVDFLRWTSGRVSLGTFTALSLWVAGVGRLISSGKLDLPEWHQLVWWGYRSFSELEEEAIDAGRTHALKELGLGPKGPRK
jgi:hypothetical protein